MPNTAEKILEEEVCSPVVDIADVDIGDYVRFEYLTCETVVPMVGYIAGVRETGFLFSPYDGRGMSGWPICEAEYHVDKLVSYDLLRKVDEYKNWTPIDPPE